MGPALTRLFAESKYNGRYDGTDAMEIIECDRAQDKIHCILATHGEALIAALEKALQCFEITQRVKDYPVDHWASKAQQLLAQLDLEARP